jgi:hypothetical protein
LSPSDQRGVIISKCRDISLSQWSYSKLDLGPCSGRSPAIASSQSRLGASGDSLGWIEEDEVEVLLKRDFFPIDLFEVALFLFSILPVVEEELGIDCTLLMSLEVSSSGR